MSTTAQTLRSSQRFDLHPPGALRIIVTDAAPASATAVGYPVSASGAPPTQLGLSRERLNAAGFSAKAGSVLCIPRSDGPMLVAVGIGAADQLDASGVRDAAAAFADAAATHDVIAFSLEGLGGVPIDAAAQAAVEGILLARYEYRGFGREPKINPVRDITLAAPHGREAASAGAERGRIYARATILARDLANTPHSHLTATHLGEIAVELAAKKGLDVEIFDKEALLRLGCGGLLGVNAGSAEPPCMIKLTYAPKQQASGRLAFVGKGVMYDSGGVSLKPNDNVHARMKNDMSGAAAALAAMGALHELHSPTAVTAFLMCTDNMPSATATALGDVITTRGGRTVEVNNTDAEGRLIMCDALALATEEHHDAIVDIATLTGSVMRALGTDLAGLFGNDDALIEQVKRAAAATGESVWQMPLHRPYRSAIESDVASMKNTGPTGGAQPDGIIAALYLSEFVADSPWAHIDICGTAWNEKSHLWRRQGCTGFGARLLIELAMNFRPTAQRTHH